MTSEEVVQQFNIPVSDVVGIYPYGSRIYGCHTYKSDHDWVIVYKSLLPSGDFRDNAISSEDRSHQAICYSRSGFQAAIDTYDITALECLFLPQEKVLLKKLNFSVRKWVAKEMCDAIISKASTSWHRAQVDLFKHHDEERARKNVYHALRILGFGLQMAETGRIMDYSAYNHLRKAVLNDLDFSISKFIGMRDNMMQCLRSKTA